MPGIAIIIGAGASFDCASERTGSVNRDFRPPLVDQLFDNRGSFDRILNKYPKARALSARIREERARDRGLEDILREIAHAPQETIRRQYFEVPLYLQELLGEVSAHFISAGGSRFDMMVADLEQSGYDNILYITVNYDLFLEQALHGLYDVAFDNISDYCPDGRKWALIKLHGSVRWGQKLLNSSSIGADMVIEDDPKLDNEIVVLGGYQKSHRMTEDGFYYPSLAVPLGDKDLACPDSHVHTMRKRLEDCSTILMVGFSALDQHVLEHFKMLKNVKKIGSVSENAENARQTFDRCQPYNARFNDVVTKTRIFGGSGFGEFVGSGRLREFLSETPR